METIRENMSRNLVSLLIGLLLVSNTTGAVYCIKLSNHSHLLLKSLMPISQRSEVNYLTNLNTLALNTVKLIADIVISKAVPERGGYKWAYEVKGVKIYSPVVGRGLLA